MEPTVNQFFRQAGIGPGLTPDNKNVFARQDGKLAGSSAFSIFKGHSRAQENDATAQKFLDSISRHPVYSKCLEQAKTVLTAQRAKGKPLTSRTIALVKQTMDQKLGVDLKQAISFGKQLAERGVIPEGFGTSFGHFWMTHPRGQTDVVGESVHGDLLKDFLKTELLSQHMAKVCGEKGLGGQAQTVFAILDKSGLLNQALDRAFEGHALDAHTLSFESIMDSIEGSLEKTLNVLDDLKKSGTSLDRLKDLPDLGDLLKTMVDAVDSGSVSRTDLNEVYVASRMESWNLSTPQGRSDGIRGYQLNTLTTDVMKGILQELELPENLAAPLGHHPDVLSDARKALDVNVPPPGMPTKDQARIALKTAMQAFMEKKLPMIKEFVAMSKDAPVELTPKALSPQTLPRFINVLLEGDKLLDPLLGGEMPENFLDTVSRHSQVVESCTHGVTGDFGSDDFLNIQKGAIQLLLARRGVQPSQIKPLVQSVIQKFGPLASQLASVSTLAGQGKLDGVNPMGLQLRALAGYRTLESHLTALLKLVPEGTLQEMNLPGKDDGQRLGNLLESKFQKLVPKEELSDEIRTFMRANGGEIEDMSEDVKTRLEKTQVTQQEQALARARNDVFDSVMEEFFPPGSGSNMEENPIMFYTAFDEANKTTDLSGIDPDKVKSGNLYKPAFGAVSKWLKEHPGPVTPAQLRTVVMDSIAESLKELKTTLDGIDQLPEPRRGLRTEVKGAFTAKQKEMMKEMAMSTGLRDVDVIVRMAELGRSNGTFFKAMCRDRNTEDNLSEAIYNLTSSFQPLMEYLEKNEVANKEDALGGMLMLTMRFSGLEPDELRNAFDSLNGALGQKVSGAFMLASEKGGMTQQRMLGAIRVMEELRTHLGTQLGVEVERDPLFFAQTTSQIHEIAPRVMDNINRLSHGTFSSLDVKLSEVAPKLTSGQRKTLSSIAERLLASVPDRQKFVMESLIKSNAKELLQAQQDRGDRPLTPKQIWKAVTGRSGPFRLKEGEVGGRLLQHVMSSYSQALKIAAPDMLPAQRQGQVIVALDLGISYQKLMALTRPGAKLTLNDVGQSLEMSSLKDYGRDNAYGLTTDFSRRGRNTVMRFESKDNRVLRTSPFSISEQENTPSHPQFKQMIDHVRGMTSSSGQLARTLQAFSQAPLIMPRVLSTLFPGVQFSEHGNFSVSAKQLEDNTVEVTIDSDPELPIQMHQKFVIDTNGDHRCTEFTMERK